MRDSVADVGCGRRTGPSPKFRNDIGLFYRPCVLKNAGE